MVAMRRLVIVVALLVAGCTSNAEVTPEEGLKRLDLETSDPNLGVIRGVVVDTTFRPIVGATVELFVQGVAAANVTTNEGGAFGFDQLAPGLYLLRSAHASFEPGQTTAEVVAGVSEPEPVKLVLIAIPPIVPYFLALSFESMEDGEVYAQAAGFVVDQWIPLGTGTGTDTYAADIGSSQVPSWIQIETVWEATSDLSQNIRVFAGVDGSGDPWAQNSSAGPSPLLTILPPEELAGHEYGDAVVYSVPYAYAMDPTLPAGAGGFVEQRITHYIHVFFGFTPADGWRFTEDGDPVVPSA
jgi:hypothetical protein